LLVQSHPATPAPPATPPPPRNAWPTSR